MSDLVLSGNLRLFGTLRLAATGGGRVKVKVAVGTKELLVIDPSSQTDHGKGVPVMLPAPPAIPSPLDDGDQVRIVTSFNRSVTVIASGVDRAVVAMGMTQQGRTPAKPWPGMVLPSTANAGVLVGGIAANVVGDTGITLPNGGEITFNTSGQ